jgi:dUTP pyrophosphatase
MVRVEVVLLDPELALPARQHTTDAGYDLVAAADVHLEPGERALVGTGIAIALPIGYAAFVLPRSGLAVRHGVSLVNTPGLIDSGYRDELRVIVINHDPDLAFDARRGERIAQLVVQRVEDVEWTVVERLGGSDRGLGGFGSTGV